MAREPAGARCAGPTSVPILHLHLLQRCNLSCAHCYSASSPTARAALTREEALGAVDLAERLGYTHLAISGGEPLLSPHLDAVLARARSFGMHASVVTNGIQAATPANLARLAGADSVCVSLDGIGATHDEMRGRAGAFDIALRALVAMGDAGLHCGVSCGVSRRSLDEMEAVAAVAHKAGAGFLHFHAVEASGRALDLPTERLLARSDETVLYVASHLLAQAAAGRFAIHCDLLHKDCVAEAPTLLYGEPLQAGSVAAQLGVLVVEPTGLLSPVCYGFERRLSLGSLSQAIATHGESVAAALPPVAAALAAAGAALRQQLEADEEWVVFNPSAELARVAALQ